MVRNYLDRYKQVRIPNTIKRWIINFGLSNKERIKRMPLLNRVAKRIYYKMLAPESSEFTAPSEFTASRDLIYLGDHRALTRTIYGHKIFVDTRDLSLAPHILLDGYWEMWIANVVADTIKEGMTVLEIGTNIGYYTLLAASKIAAGGRLYAFEANPEMFEILFQNMAINGFLDRATLVNKAVSDKSGNLKFHKFKHHKAGSSIVEYPKESLAQLRDEIETIEVEAFSVDEYFTEETHIDVIKIDAEGSEALIFKGMRKLLENNPHIKIICEFAPQLISGTGEDPRIFLEEIKSHGFKLKKIDTSSKLVDVSVDELLSVSTCELFLARG